MKTKKHNKAGFTLVELMVVAIIVAILAAVAIPLMSGNKKRAAATEAQAGCSTIYTAERVHFAENGTYVNAASPVHTALQGINNGDLEGKYFDHTSYAVTAASTNGFTCTATANGTEGINGTVILTVGAGGTATWTGTLLQ
jgi:prepilin-type N-terminal cleavage/methylation domain-containing protein